jgi:hypothetical protein
VRQFRNTANCYSVTGTFPLFNNTALQSLYGSILSVLSQYYFSHLLFCLMFLYFASGVFFFFNLLLFLRRTLTSSSISGTLPEQLPCSYPNLRILYRCQHESVQGSHCDFLIKRFIRSIVSTKINGTIPTSFDLLPMKVLYSFPFTTSSLRF